MGWAPALLEEIRRRCDLVALVSQTVELRPRGRELVGLCPFHPERSPSFYVSPEKQVFHCFGCGAAGDAFTFLMRRDRLSFGEAATVLAERTGVELRPDSPAERRRRAERERCLEALAAAAAAYRAALEDGESGAAARAYLAGRGVGREAAELFGLGFAPPGGSWLWRRLGQTGLDVEVLERAGLVLRHREGVRDRFTGRLMFPIRDEGGRVVGFGGRVLGEGEPKYLNSPETPVFSKRRVWFGLDLARPALREGGAAIVMEGYMDVVSAHQAGFTTAVASLGTALGPEQAQLLRRYAEEAVVAYDADAAGARAAWRSLSILQRAGLRVRVARIPEGKDPDDFLRVRGSQAFTRVLAEALPLLDYAFAAAAEGRDLSRPESKATVASAVAPFLLGEEDPVAQAAQIRELAGRLGVAEEAVRQLLLRRARGDGRGAARRETAAALASVAESGSGHSKRKTWDTKTAPAGEGEFARSALLLAEQRVAARALADAGWRLARAGRLTSLSFLDAACGRLVAAALAHPETEGSGILDLLGEDVEARELAAALLSAEPPEAGAADGFLASLERRSLAERLAALEERLRRAAREGAELPAQEVAAWQDLQRRLRGREGRPWR